MFQPRSHPWALNGASPRRREVIRLVFAILILSHRWYFQNITDGQQAHKGTGKAGYDSIAGGGGV